MNIEVTRRELLLSIIIVLVMVGLGFLISAKVHDSVSVSNEKYFNALKIDKDDTMFNYALNTEVGYILSSGTVAAVESVSDPLIDGEYFSIRKVEEHYVMKTRTVTYTDSEGNTKTRTETYWEWDEVKRTYDHIKEFTYLGHTFKHGHIRLDNYSYLKTVKKGMLSDVRYKFYTMPTEFDIALFSQAKEGTITPGQSAVYYNQSIESVIDMKEGEATMFVVFFWIIWVILTIAAVVGFVALDNRFINNH